MLPSSGPHWLLPLVANLTGVFPLNIFTHCNGKRPIKRLKTASNHCQSNPLYFQKRFVCQLYLMRTANPPLIRQVSHSALPQASALPFPQYPAIMADVVQEQVPEQKPEQDKVLNGEAEEKEKDEADPSEETAKRKKKKKKKNKSATTGKMSR